MPFNPAAFTASAIGWALAGQPVSINRECLWGVTYSVANPPSTSIAVIFRSSLAAATLLAINMSAKALLGKCENIQGISCCNRDELRTIDAISHGGCQNPSVGLEVPQGLTGAGIQAEPIPFVSRSEYNLTASRQYPRRERQPRHRECP